MVIRSNVIGGCAPIRITTDTIFYVSTTGNDDTGTGSAAAPFKTISRAVDVVNNLAASPYVVNISVLDGAYSENKDLVITHSQRYLYIRAYSGTETGVTLSFPMSNYIHVLTSNCTIIYNLVINIPNGNYVIDVEDSTAIFNYLTLNNVGATKKGSGIICSRSLVETYRSQFNNFQWAIASNDSALVNCDNNSGTGNAVAHFANCGIITRNGTYPSATTVDTQQNGGRIFT